MKCVHGISIRKPCGKCVTDAAPGKPICSCNGRGESDLILHSKNCPVRVAVQGQVKP